MEKKVENKIEDNKSNLALENRKKINIKWCYRSYKF